LKSLAGYFILVADVPGFDQRAVKQVHEGIQLADRQLDVTMLICIVLAGA
jgi:hypothetical protein